MADLVFRRAGQLTILLLLTTVVLRLLDAEWWTTVFLAGHLAALVALLPLGIVLVRHGLRRSREEGQPGLLGAMRRYPWVTVLVAVIFVAVVVTLASFGDQDLRALRRVANFTTVAAVLVLVAMYLRWAQRRRGLTHSPDMV